MFFYWPRVPREYVHGSASKGGEKGESSEISLDPSLNIQKFQVEFQENEFKGEKKEHQLLLDKTSQKAEALKERKQRMELTKAILNPSTTTNPILRSKNAIHSLSVFDQQWGPKKGRKQWLNLSVQLLEGEYVDKQALGDIQKGFSGILDTLEKVPDPNVQLGVKGVKYTMDFISGVVRTIKSNGNFGITMAAKLMNARVHFKTINNHFFALMMSIEQLENIENSLKNHTLEPGVVDNIKKEKIIALDRIKKLSTALYDSYGWVTSSKGSIFDPKWFNTLDQDRQRLLIYVMDYGLNFSKEKTILLKEPVYEKFTQLVTRNTNTKVGGPRNALGGIAGGIAAPGDKIVHEAIENRGKI